MTPVSLAFAFAYFVAGALGTHVMAAAATRHAAKGTRFGRISLLPDIGAIPMASIGGLAACLTLSMPGQWDFAAVMTAATAILLAAGALADARWAWAPDTIMLPIAILAPLAAGHGPMMPVYFAGLVGLPLLIWAVLELVHQPLMTPPDMMALALPPVLFGFSYLTVATYFATAAILLVSLKVAALRGASEALADAGAHTGLAEFHPGRPRIALLAVMFPLIMAALLISKAGIL
jgi:hypothetical protein